MSAVTVEVVQDARFPHGGHAVIRLNGLWLLPPQAKFRIDPVDDAVAVEAGAWPSGERSPLETRVTSRGVEIMVGPDVVDASGLQPGTPVSISVPAAAIAAELRWPNLPVSSAPRRGQVIMSAAELRAEIATAERMRREREQAAADAEAERLARLHAEAQADRLRRERSEASSLSSLQPRGGETIVMVKDEASVSAAASAWPSSIERVAAIQDPPRPAPPRPAPGAQATASAQIASTPLVAKVTATETIDVEVSDPIAAARNPDGSIRLAPTGTNSIVPRAPSVNDGPDMQQMGTQSRHYQRRQMVSFGLGFLAAAGLSWLFWSGISSELRKPAVAAAQSKSQSATAASVAAVAAVSPAAVRAAAEAGVSLKDVFAVDKVSPRGRAATDVDLTAALRLADESLHGATADRQESAFWLRKSLSVVLNQDEVKWALTQLGSSYAAPASGPPDYTKARLVWEISGSQGDPVALCFLGSVHELGLGVAAAKATALGYFNSAKAAGGCRGVDDAIARLKE